MGMIYLLAQRQLEKRPQRGLIYITAGLDLRGQIILIATTLKGSHNKNNCTIVRHLRSRPLHSYIRRRSRPAVTIVRPLWGLTAKGIVPSSISLPNSMLSWGGSIAFVTLEQCFCDTGTVLS